MRLLLLPACLVLIGRVQGWSWTDGEVDAGSIAYQVKHSPDVALHLLQANKEVNVSARPHSFLSEEVPGSCTHRHRKAVQLVQFREENDWKNDLILFAIPKQWRSGLPGIVQSWLRNYLACVAVYFGVSGAWVYYAYWCFGHLLYGRGNMPTPGDVYEQMRVAMGSMPGYAVLPAMTEAIVERGWTAAYPRIGDVGLWRHALNFGLYMACVEFGVYWMHRLLHDIRIGYRNLHYVHHKYNKEGSLSPFAGLAFHPLDGIIQALPYCVLLLVLPMHFLTHELMLFLTGVWTTNIHDNLHARIAPIMGAGYHTIHHTTYLHNYGHYTIYMDGLFGTLVDPDAFAEKRVAVAARD